MNKTAARASLVGKLFRPVGRYFQLLRGGNKATLKPFTDADSAIRDAIRFAKGPGGEGVKWPVWERLFGLGRSDLGITYDSAMARKDLVRHLEAMRKKLHADIRTPGVTESAVPKALPRPGRSTSPDDVEGMADRLWPFSRTEHYVFSPDVKSELAAVRRARLLTALAGGTAVAGGGVAAARGGDKSRGRGGLFKASAASPKGRLLKIILGVTALGALGYGAKKGIDHMGGDKPEDPGVSGILDMLADKARAAASSGAEWAKAHPGGAAAVAMSPLALYGLREMVRKMRGSGDGAGDGVGRAEPRQARMPMPYPYGGEAYLRMPIPAYGL